MAQSNKKIGIIADSLQEFQKHIIHYLKLNPQSDEAKKYKYISIYEYDCVSGIELESFYIISPRLNDIYNVFNKVKSRVR